MKKINPVSTPVRQAVASMMAIGALVAATPAQATQEFKLGNYDLSVNSTISAGISMRMEDQDPALFSANNVNSDGVRGRGLSNTGDDGNLNFNKGDVFSTVIKGVHDFNLTRDNHGFFARVKWFYDHTLNNDSVFHGHEPTSNQRNRKLNDNGFHPFARFDGIDLLDAFYYLNTSVADKPLNLRVGRQVVSWGESLFIPSPISGLNTIDVSAFRRPGAELKEGFTPSEMLYFNLGATENTSVEAFYQLKWRKTVPDGCGTFFSTSDVGADGCNRLAFIGAGVPDSVQLSPGFAANVGGGVAVGPINRSQDRQPDNGGQYGVALRTYVPAVTTEFGLYALNYHSRLPFFGFKGSNVTFPASGGALPFALGGTDGSYFIDYPEDITVLGASFSTNLGAWSVGGELTHTLDLPIAYNANDLLAAGLTAGFPSPTPNPLAAKARALRPGERLEGFERFDVTQVQVAGIRTFDQVLNAQQVVFAGEVGMVFVDGLPDVAPGQRFGRATVFGGGANDTKGYVTDFSWGYRLRTAATYRDVIGSVDLIPGIAWSHDVEGYSPEPGQVFNEGRRSLGLSLGFEFNPNTRASIAYTRFANSAAFDPLRDRDFLSGTVSYSF